MSGKTTLIKTILEKGGPFSEALINSDYKEEIEGKAMTLNFKLKNRKKKEIKDHLDLFNDFLSRFYIKKLEFKIIEKEDICNVTLDFNYCS